MTPIKIDTDRAEKQQRAVSAEPAGASRPSKHLDPFVERGNGGSLIGDRPAGSRSDHRVGGTGEVRPNRWSFEPGFIDFRRDPFFLRVVRRPSRTPECRVDVGR